MDEKNKTPKTVKFKLVGFQGNDEITLPDKPNDRQSKGKTSKFTSGSPKSLQDFLSMLENADKDPNIAKQLDDTLSEQLRKLGINISVLERNDDEDSDSDDEEDSDSDDDEEDECDSLAYLPFPNGSILTLLNPDNVYNIPCKSDPELYHKFVEKYGDTNISFDAFPPSVKLTDLTGVFPVGSIQKLTVIDYSDKFVLLSCESENPAEVIAYIAAYETPNGDIDLYVPIYGNPFKTDEGTLYSRSDHNAKNLFDKSLNFKFIDIDKIETGLDMALVPVKNPLITPNKFGTFKKRICSVPKEGGNAVRIGVLQSNENADAKMFKRDFDFPADKLKFDFYLHFNASFSYSDLLVIASVLLNEIEYKNTVLFDECELKANKDCLYIDVDVGKLGERISYWVDDKGNAC